ncbi:MAG: hypothetical protein ABIF17_04720 [Patescibacteria group bacterium]
MSEKKQDILRGGASGLEQTFSIQDIQKCRADLESQVTAAIRLREKEIKQKLTDREALIAEAKKMTNY